MSSQRQSKSTSSQASMQLVYLLALSCLSSSQGFVHRHGLCNRRRRPTTPLSAVQLDPRKLGQRPRVLSNEEEDSLERLRIERTSRERNVLQEFAGHIEIFCGSQEVNDTTSSKENANHDQKQGSNCNERPDGMDDEEAAQERRKLAARAALLGSRSPQAKQRSSSSRTNSRTSTSVGSKRVGSASKARQGPGVTKRIMDAVRKSASSNKPTDFNDNSQNPENNNPPSASLTPPLSRKLNPAGIHSAVMEALMERQRKEAKPTDIGLRNWNQPLQPANQQPLSTTPPHGTVLVPPSVDLSSKRETKLQFPECLTVRVAHGLQAQDTEVAHLRLSVFSDFSPEVRRQLVSRSVNAVVTRRMKGATCLVATVPPSIAARKRNRPPVILGSAECSFHEFEGTTLGRRRPADSILYITEVAVSPNARRRGIGRKLLEAIDVLANIRGVETLYLHVDVENQSALDLYEKAGYQHVNRGEPMFLEFTTKLNLHDGATKGRNHFLLYKDMVKCPTWLPDIPVTTTTEFSQPAAGTLGFEAPC